MKLAISQCDLPTRIKADASLEEAADQVRAMRHQEETLYSGIFQANGSSGSEDLRLNWREKICQWSYNVIDQYVYPRSVYLSEGSAFAFLIAFVLRIAASMFREK